MKKSHLLLFICLPVICAVLVALYFFYTPSASSGVTLTNQSKERLSDNLYNNALSSEALSNSQKGNDTNASIDLESSASYSFSENCGQSVKLDKKYIDDSLKHLSLQSMQTHNPSLYSAIQKADHSYTSLAKKYVSLLKSDKDPDTQLRELLPDIKKQVSWEIGLLKEINSTLTPLQPENPLIASEVLFRSTNSYVLSGQYIEHCEQTQSEICQQIKQVLKDSVNFSNLAFANAIKTPMLENKTTPEQESAGLYCKNDIKKLSLIASGNLTQHYQQYSATNALNASLSPFSK